MGVHGDECRTPQTFHEERILASLTRYSINANTTGIQLYLKLEHVCLRNGAISVAETELITGPSCQDSFLASKNTALAQSKETRVPLIVVGTNVGLFVF